LIQQTQYTPTTTKYNFPHTSLEDTALPTKFIELSLKTIKNIENSTTLYQPYEAGAEDQTDEATTPTFLGQTRLKLNPIQLKPIQEETPVTAIDVSSIKIGETTTGILLALRGAIVSKNKNHYHYLRIGPFPFHITEENKTEITQHFNQYSYDFETQENNHMNVPSIIHMQTRLTTLLERWLQASVTSQTQGTIILLDGSLTAGTPDTPVNVLAQLLQKARIRLNTILAFSKMTRLRLQGHRLTDLTEKCKPPCLMEMEGYPTALSNTIRFLGNIYVAKLTPGNCSFRLDIDQKLDHNQAVEATQRLIANDLVTESYPETLRLAHIYSTFTANEVIGIQRFLAQTHGIKTVTRPNIRRLLFGPFGKGPEGA
jgi:hypothetical protein